jgi:hypothetical protein
MTYIGPSPAPASMDLVERHETFDPQDGHGAMKVTVIG